MRDTVLDQIAKVPDIIGSLAFDVTVTTRPTQTIDRATNKALVVAGTDTVYKAVIDAFKSNEIKDYGVEVDDVKLIVFTDGDDINPSSKINVNGADYEILKPIPIYVGNTIGVMVLHLRK